MAEGTAPMLERDMAHAVNLMAHPTAAFAAASAIGLGLASQAMGMWLGAAAGVAEAALRISRSAEQAFATPSAPAPAAQRARAAARTLIDDARSLAEEVSEAGTRTPAAVLRPKQTAQLTRTRTPRPPRTPAMARPAAIGRPDATDDLKAIGGIGPKLEQVLNGLGIWTYAQIAAWTELEIAWIEDQIGFAGRIGRDGWTGQARKLAKAMEA